MLTCQRQELVPHAHSEGCYDEAGALVCGLPVVGEHQHSQDCVSVPDGEPQEVKTLVCGLEEHVHVDACYVELIPNENDKYFCKKEEHLHTRECYFESGALRCTLEEHLHTAACLEEQPDEPPEGTDDPPPQEPEPDPVPGVTLEDYPFVYEGEAFTVTYRISGVARLAEGNQPGDPSQEPEPTPSATDEPQPTEPPQGEVDLGGQEYIEIPLAFKPRGMASHTDSEPDASAPPEDGGAGSATDPGGDAVYNSVPMPPEGAGTDDPAGADPQPGYTPGQGTELDPALVEIRVEELTEDDPRFQAVMGTEAAREDEEPLLQ